MKPTKKCLTTEFKDASKSELLIVQSPAVSYWGSGLVDTFEQFAATLAEYRREKKVRGEKYRFAYVAQQSLQN